MSEELHTNQQFTNALGGPRGLDSSLYNCERLGLLWKFSTYTYVQCLRPWVQLVHIFFGIFGPSHFVFLLECKEDETGKLKKATNLLRHASHALSIRRLLEPAVSSLLL